jgi:hypothetical protein
MVIFGSVDNERVKLKALLQLKKSKYNGLLLLQAFPKTLYMRPHQVRKKFQTERVNIW